MDEIRCTHCGSKYVRREYEYKREEECGHVYSCDSCKKRFEVTTFRAPVVKGDLLAVLHGRSDCKVSVDLEIYRGDFGNTVCRQFIKGDGERYEYLDDGSCKYWDDVDSEKIRCTIFENVEKYEKDDRYGLRKETTGYYPRYLLIYCVPTILPKIENGRISIYYKCQNGEVVDQQNKSKLVCYSSSYKVINRNPRISYITLYDKTLIKAAEKNEAVKIMYSIGKEWATIDMGECPSEVVFNDFLDWLWDTFPEWKEKSKKWEEEIEQGRQAYMKDEKRGCYVATCVYGSYDCPAVWTLRRFRDDTLGATWLGRLFIRTYYAVSPTLVKWFGKTKWFRGMFKPMLDKMVRKLNAKGIADTPYQDKNW